MVTSLEAGLPASNGHEELAEGCDLELGDAACAAWARQAEPLPAVLQLVIDLSGSMNQQAAGSTLTQWAITREMLTQALDGLPATTAVGLTFYPDQPTPGNLAGPLPATACIDTSDNVAIAPLGAEGSPHRQALARALASAHVEVRAGSPTHDAYRLALAPLQQLASAANQSILLITDGQPTYSLGCRGSGLRQPVDPVPIVDEIAAARAAGIRTFVIGSAGTQQDVSTAADARGWLSRAASVGGTARADCADTGPTFCHFDLTQEPDLSVVLRDALTSVAGQLVSCLYQVPVPPPGQPLYPDAVNVVSTGPDGTSCLVPRNDGDPCQRGWRYVRSGTQLEICGETCQSIQTQAQGSVRLEFGCESESRLGM
jgi:hypothetical protein